MMSLNASEEPMPMRARRADIVVVIPTAVTGMDVRWSTWKVPLSVHDAMGPSRIAFR